MLDRPDFLTVFDDAQLRAQALVALDTFNSAWLIGLAAFGIHPILLGYPIVRTQNAPKVLGYVMVAAGVGYVIGTAAHALLGNDDAYEILLLAVVAVPSIIGERWFALWLLLRGGKRDGDLTPSSSPSTP